MAAGKHSIPEIKVSTAVPLGHLSYCIAYYDVPLAEMAVYIRRFLRHPQFNTHAKRLGKVSKITTQRIEFWQVGHSTKSIIRW